MVLIDVGKALGKPWWNPEQGLGIQNLSRRMSRCILKKTPSPKLLSNLSSKLGTRGVKMTLALNHRKYTLVWSWLYLNNLCYLLCRPFRFWNGRENTQKSRSDQLRQKQDLRPKNIYFQNEKHQRKAHTQLRSDTQTHVRVAHQGAAARCLQFLFDICFFTWPLTQAVLLIPVQRGSRDAICSQRGHAKWQAPALQPKKW